MRGFESVCELLQSNRFYNAIGYWTCSRCWWYTVCELCIFYLFNFFSKSYLILTSVNVVLEYGMFVYRLISMYVLVACVKQGVWGGPDFSFCYTVQTRMWSDAQCDGRPAPRKCLYSVSAQETAKHCAKFCLPAVSDVATVTKTRRETRWNLLGCLKLSYGSQPLVGWSSPYCEDNWRRYCCLTSFFPIVDVCLNCEDIARQIWAMVRRWRFLAIFWVLHFQRAACSTFQTCILNSH